MSKSTPAPPDYKGAAEQQAASDKEALTAQTHANRPRQENPWGTVDYETSLGIDPATGQQVTNWTQKTTLDPTLQQALDSQMGLQAGRSGLGESLMGRAQDEYGTPMDWGNLTDWGGVPQAGEEARKAAEDALYSRATSRLDPEFAQAEDDMHARLVAQGLREGDPAYNRSMENFERDRQQAYGDARDRAISAGGAEQQRQFGMNLDASQYQSNIRQNELTEAMQRRGFSLNEINALLSGQQVGMPGFQGFSNAGRGQATNYLGAAGMQHNANMQNWQAENAGMNALLGGIGTGAGMYFGLR